MSQPKMEHRINRIPNPAVHPAREVWLAFRYHHIQSRSSGRFHCVAPDQAGQLKFAATIAESASANWNSTDLGFAAVGPVSTAGWLRRLQHDFALVARFAVLTP